MADQNVDFVQVRQAEFKRTCEDRGYVCCDAMPAPEGLSNAGYQEWYDRHVAAYLEQTYGEDEQQAQPARQLQVYTHEAWETYMNERAAALQAETAAVDAARQERQRRVDVAFRQLQASLHPH